MKNLISTIVGLLVCAAFAKSSTPAGWIDDYDAALKKAATEKKLVLADFSGSDWCGWCKRLDREVFDTDAFRKGIEGKYVLLMVDSPRDKSLLSEQAAKRNPELVKKYRVSGFPTVLLLDAKGEVIAKTGYAEGGPEKYLAALDELARGAPDRLKYLKPIEDVLNRHDAAMEGELENLAKELKAKFPEPAATASEKERKQWRKKAQKEMSARMFGEIAPKYVPLYEKAFEEAKAMKVPERLESKKQEIISEQEQRFQQLKTMMSVIQAKNAATAAKKAAKAEAKQPAGKSEK